MKTCIYVFSGTGTSLAVAKKIADSLDNAELKLIPTILKNAEGNEINSEATTIGFVFPNYFSRIPDIVLRFINTINLDKANYIFSVVTSGGGPGHSLKALEHELIKKGKKLNYGKSITVSSNYIVARYYKFVCNTGKKRANALHKLEQKAKQFANDISCEKNEIEVRQFQLSLLFSSKSPSIDTQLWDKKLSIEENCNGCRTCENVCQVRNIKMKNEKPDFQHNCQWCMACLQYCPQYAIGFRGRPLIKSKYFHPDYPAKEMINFIRENR